MKTLLVISFIVLSICSIAQTPDDALRTAWFSGNGTARNVALGGAGASLGGDISAANINPAGIGIYKTSEWLFGGSVLINNNKLSYRGTDTSNNKSTSMLGTSGVVFAYQSNQPYSSWVSSALSFSFNQLANYNNRIQYSGFNNTSSFSEQYLEELQRDGADTNSALSNYIFGSSLAYRTYLIDTISGPGNSVQGFQSLVPLSTGVWQKYDAITSGGYNELAIAYAGNSNNNFYLGGSIIIPIINYKRQLTYSETDATTDTSNQFKSFTYKENFTSKGAGIGLKIGLIYKPQDNWRIGLAFHTPQLISYKDEIRSQMTTNTESYAGVKSESSDNLNNGQPGTRQYNITTPYRMIISGSYLFGSSSDVKEQHGFITGDIEYVNYKGARFKGLENADQGTLDYLKQVNDAVKSYYKGNINVRLGGELKLNTFMIRLGTAYYGSPYSNSTIKASSVLTTGGIGYRGHGMFIDLALSHTMLTDANFPYRLSDKPNTYSIQKTNTDNIVFTVGFKF